MFVLPTAASRRRYYINVAAFIANNERVRDAAYSGDDRCP
jgi:hypothetical protein